MSQVFSLIVCTYMRPQALLRLLESVKTQRLYPDEILIIDGSTNDATQNALELHTFKNLQYFKVDAAHRGLTKQRNYGILKLSEASEVVCFLDDDTVLEPDYFENLLHTYKLYPDALAVGGYITNEIHWEVSNQASDKNKFYYDGFMRNEPSRFKLRRTFGLEPDAPPGFLPSFSHGRSIGFLPPSGKTYEVEQIMGGVSSYKKSVFTYLKFSSYFEGYGLYEDTDFSLRLAKKGKLYVNTKAQLQHYHDGSGRPNQYQYGKMVVRNGWYVWRVKYSKPNITMRFKWHATVLLLTLIRATNIFTSSKKQEAFTESFGRLAGWLSLLTNKPTIEQD